MISNAGFIFTQNFMNGPMDLGDTITNQLVNIQDGVYVINNKNNKIAIKDETFTLQYDSSDTKIRPYIDHPIFEKGPDENCKRFSLYALNYQVNPNDYYHNLVSFRGSFW